MYEFLDSIADAVNPALLLVALGLPIFPTIRRRVRLDRWYLCAALGLALVYAMMFVDGRFALWESLGADYSTHTAFALVLCMLIGVITRRSMISALIVLVAYIALMLAQRYHTVWDIATTGAAIAAIHAVTISLLKPRQPIGPSW